MQPRKNTEGYSLTDGETRKYIQDSSINGGDTITSTLLGLGTALVIGSGLFLAARYKVSKPEQFLVRTGLGIKDMSISRTGIVFPFQDCKYF